MPNLGTTLRRMVLTFSDQQVVTGIALLSSGFAQLNSGIDSYHWQILVYLVWFSSLTHLTTLTMLRQYFQEHAVSRLWRAVLMMITIIMLVCALLPTKDSLWLAGSLIETDIEGEYELGPFIGIPALCFYRRLGSHGDDSEYDSRASSYSKASMGVSVTILISGYLTRIIKLSSRATQTSRRWLVEKPNRLLEKTRRILLQRLEAPVDVYQKSLWCLGFVVVEPLYVFLKVLYGAYSSILWEAGYPVYYPILRRVVPDLV